MLEILPTQKQWKSWSKPTKYGFIGLVVALVGLFNIPSALYQTMTYRRLDNYHQQRSHFVDKLSEANTCLTARLYFDGLHDLESDCKIDLDGISVFSRRYAGYIATTPYSGAWNLEYYASEIETASNQINSTRSRAELKALQKRSGVNLAKIGYHMCGIEWYLRNSPPQELAAMSKARVKTYQDGWLSWIDQNGGNFGHVSFQHSEFEIIDDKECASFIDLLD